MIPNSRKLRNEPHRLLRHFPSCHGLSKYDPPDGLSKNGTGQDVCNFLQIPQNITCGSSDPVIYDLPFVWVRAGTISSLKGLHMSKAFLLSCVLITGYVAFLAVSLPDSKKRNRKTSQGPQHQVHLNLISKAFCKAWIRTQLGSACSVTNAEEQSIAKPYFNAVIFRCMRNINGYPNSTPWDISRTS